MRLPEGVSSLGCAGRVRARCVMEEVGEEEEKEGEKNGRREDGE